MRRFAALLIAVSLCLSETPPSFALRIQQDSEGPRAVRSQLNPGGGLEETGFVPWEGAAPDRVLVRRQPLQPIPEYPIRFATHLSGVFDRFMQPYLAAEHGLKETPLVYLPDVSKAFGKPVYLLRESLLPTGSFKPRMLAPLFDLYLNGDPNNITGRADTSYPKRWGTQSTGNHLLAMAWGGRQISAVTQRNLQVLGFTMRDISAPKKLRAEQFGATVLNQYGTYGEARQAMRQAAAEQGQDFLYWHHGDRPVIYGYMTTAVQLERQMQQDARLRNKKIAVVTAAGAAGRVAGLAAGLTQILPEGNVMVVGAETTRVPPLFRAVQAGRPVEVDLPADRVAEDGIAVDQVERDAFDVFVKRAHAVTLVDPEQGPAYARWLVEELKRTGWSGEKARTEVVTGVSLATLFEYRALFSGMDAVIIDETGRNIDPADFDLVEKAALPSVAVGFEEGKRAPTYGVREAAGTLFNPPLLFDRITPPAPLTYEAAPGETLLVSIAGGPIERLAPGTFEFMGSDWKGWRHYLVLVRDGKLEAIGTRRFQLVPETDETGVGGILVRPDAWMEPAASGEEVDLGGITLARTDKGFAISPGRRQEYPLVIYRADAKIGFEEALVPRPRRPQGMPAGTIWRDGGDIFPSIGERLRRMAVMASNGGPVQFLRTFASVKLPEPLPREVFEELYDGRPLFDYLPTAGAELGYLEHPSVPPYVRLRLRQLVARTGAEVAMRVQLVPGDTTKDAEIVTRVSNLYRDGAIRFEGRIPAEPEFEGEHAFSVEIGWKGNRYRLNDSGWIRIEKPNPAQVAAASPDELAIGVADAQEELTYALGRAMQVEGQLPMMPDGPAKQEAIEAIRLARTEGIVTDLLVPAGQRNPLLRRLVNEWQVSGGDRGISPAQARRIFIAQQQQAGLQKGFFVGMQFRVGVVRGGRPVQVMFNPNRANTPRPPAPVPGERVAHVLSDLKPMKIMVNGNEVILKQRAMPNQVTRLKNPLKVKVNPFGYVHGHATLPTVRQEPQLGWGEAVPSLVEEIWMERENGAVITGNIGPKAAASLPDWAHRHRVPWITPMDVPPDDEVRWFGSENGVPVGLLRQPGKTVFVLQAGPSERDQQSLIAAANKVVEGLRARGLLDFNDWGLVDGGLGRIFIMPRNPVEPVPPDAAELAEIRGRLGAQYEWKPADDYSKPLAAEDYWMVELGPGQFHLMSWEEIEAYGLERQMDPGAGYKGPYDRTRPFVRKGRPVLNIKMGSLECRGHYLISDLGVYEDRFLEARLEKTDDLIGVPWDSPAIRDLIAGIAPVQADGGADAAAAQRVQRALEAAQRITLPQEVVELCREISQWGQRESRRFAELPAGERDAFTQRLGGLVLQHATRESEHLRLVSAPPYPAADQTLPPLSALSLNGTLDLGLELRTSAEGTDYLEVRRSAGGTPANMIQAAAALRSPVQMTMVLGGPGGAALANDLRSAGIQVNEVAGPPTRISLMIARPSGGEVRLVGAGTEIPPDVVAEAVAAPRPAPAGSVPGWRVVGERVYGTAAVEAMAGEVPAARAAGLQSCVGATIGWNRATWERMMGTRPEAFVAPLDAMVRYLRETNPRFERFLPEEIIDRVRERPEEFALAVDDLRRTHGIREWLVPFRDGSMIILTDGGCLQLRASPLLRPLKYASGTNDIITTEYLRARQLHGPEQAGKSGAAAGIVFMERTDRSRLPTEEEVAASLDRVMVNRLPRFLPAGLARELNAAAADALRRFQQFHRIGLERLRLATDGREQSGVLARIGNLQEIAEYALPEALTCVIHRRYADALRLVRQLPYVLDVHVTNIEKLAQGPVTPESVERAIWVPAAEFEEYRQFLSDLRALVVGNPDAPEPVPGLIAQLEALAPTGLPLTPVLPPLPPPPVPPMRTELVFPVTPPEEITAFEARVAQRREQEARRIAEVAAENRRRDRSGGSPARYFMVAGADGIIRSIVDVMRVLAEARTANGVLVVPAEAVAANPMLQRWLREMPAEFARTVVIWGDTPAGRQAVEQNRNLREYLDRQNMDGFVAFLTALAPDRVGVLQGDSSGRLLAALRATLPVPVQEVPINLALLFQLLGVPEAVTTQVGLEELQRLMEASTAA